MQCCSDCKNHSRKEIAFYKFEYIIKGVLGFWGFGVLGPEFGKDADLGAEF